MSTILANAETVAAASDHHAFNRAVWDRLVSDPELAPLDWRIETDEHGQIIMSPPPAPSHGSFQSEAARRLGNWNPGGRVITECPISTRKGVKAADVAWCSARIWDSLDGGSCFETAPEICVEVLSPSNTHGEIEEKKALYFEEGALEVWFVSGSGQLSFFLRKDPGTTCPAPEICAEFPLRI